MSISPDGRSEITLKLCLLRHVEKKWVEEEQSVDREEVEDKEVEDKEEVDDKEEGDGKVGASVKEEDKIVDQGDLFGVLQIWYFPRSGHGCGCISGPGLELFESGITYMACFVSKTI